MIQLIVAGNTYNFKESLRADKFRWNPVLKAWTRNFNDGDDTIKDITKKYSTCNGISIGKKTLAYPDDRKYWVKESWIFNLESMHDKLWCIVYDIRDNKIKLPITVADKVIKSEDDIWELLNEAEDLEWKAKSGTVTGKQYGRIKAIVEWRVGVRYTTCLEAGMSEAKAGRCFEDM